MVGIYRPVLLNKNANSTETLSIMTPLTFDCVMLKKWHDEYLLWNPGDYGGVMAVRLDAQDVWLPDIMLYNT